MKEYSHYHHFIVIASEPAGERSNLIQRIEQGDCRVASRLFTTTIFIMSFTNFQKTIALTSGVLVLSVAIGYIVLAWDGPTAEPPSGNASAPINVSSDAQTKAGDLTVSELTTSGGKLYLNNSGFEGDIERVNEIIGHNDLQLRDSADETKIDLDVGDSGEIGFYTDGWKRMKIEKDGDLYKQGDLYIENGDLNIEELTNVPDFDGCFLELDENGKVKCYTGGGIPGGNLLETTQVEVASANTMEPGVWVCDSYTILEVEKVIRVHAIIISMAYRSVHSIFYINGAEEWVEYRDSNMSLDDSKYYHVTDGDVLKICVKAGEYSTASAKIYTLRAKRELITHAFSDGEILYWYDQAVIEEMSPAGVHYIAPDILNPASVIISAKDEVDVKWILD